MYCLTYDVGTTGVKTCLFEVTDQIRTLASASEGYGLQVVPGAALSKNPMTGGRQWPPLPRK